MIRSLLILVFLLPLAGVSQIYNFRVFAEAEGLPQNYVYHISQTGTGKLVISTGEALCVFDGINFKTVSDNQLSELFISSHYVDHRNRFWLAHHQGGVTLIDGNKQKRFGEGELANEKVLAIAPFSETSVLAITAQNIFSVDTSGTVSKIEHTPDQFTFCQTITNGEFIAGNENGMFLLSVSDNKCSTTPIALTDNETPVRITRAWHDSDAYWVLTASGTLQLIKKTHGQFKSHGNLDIDFTGRIPTCIYGGSGGGLYVAITERGVIRIMTEPDQPLKAASVQTISTRNGLNTSQIQTIYEDREGNMWFGTLGDGLIQKPATRFAFYGINEGLKVPQITALLPGSNGVLWIGSPTGLYRYHRNELYSGPEMMTGKKITSLAADPSGKIWIGTENDGVWQFDTVTKKLIQAGNIPRGAHVNFLTVHRRKLYAATTEGLFVTGGPEEPVEKLRTNDGLLHNNVHHVFFDRLQRMWISSRGAPPYYISEGKAHPFKKINSLSAFNIIGVTQDNEGAIWIATEGDGVFSYNGTQFTEYSAAGGLLSDFCTGIFCDRKGTVWVTHRNGLSSRATRKKRFISHGARNGLLFVQNNPHAVAEDGLGYNWFGTANGLVSYFTEGRVSDEFEPEVNITSIKINDRVYGPENEIEVIYGEYTFEVSFLSVCLNDPGAISYKYRMANLDSSWTETSERSVTFPKLTDGQYDFEVMACHQRSGKCSKIVRTILKVAPPVWKRPWFYLMLLAAVAGVTYAIVQIRTSRLRRSQLMLQLKVKQKTFLLQREKQAVEAIKQELEEKNKDITDSINYAKRIQDSILPPDEALTELFGEDYFVLFKPKDIVSGDFYWAAALQRDLPGSNPLALAAVIDCTGHGVPGAFLSIMANDFLRQSIQRHDVKTPDQALNFLNESVSSHLNQTSKSKIRDGMDIALIGIDQKTSTLYFSGANNPIYIFRSIEGNVDQIILTATKQAIGMVTEETRPYALREFQLQPGDVIYLFSDGYADQFGGPNGKKLSYKRFRDILLSAYHLPMRDQQQILKVEFEKWMGDGYQTDDVCVMGIRIR